MVDETKSFFEVPTVAIVTGASRGIGRAIATEFAKRFTRGLLLIITGRSEKDLEETASMIRSDDEFSSSVTTLRLVIGDLGNRESFHDLIEDLFKSIDPSNYDHAVLVNNAASTGDVTKFVRDWDMTASETLNEYFFMNVVSVFFLVSKFLSVFTSRELKTAEKKPTRKTIVQLTSLSAVVPTECMSPYCAGKAAREMLHNVAALEEPDVRVLSYAPGPVDTAMLNHLSENTASLKTKEQMTKSLKMAVSPQETVSVLCDYLKEDQYESGSRIDLFDIIGFPKAE